MRLCSILSKQYTSIRSLKKKEKKNKKVYTNFLYSKSICSIPLENIEIQFVKYFDIFYFDKIMKNFSHV